MRILLSLTMGMTVEHAVGGSPRRSTTPIRQFAPDPAYCRVGETVLWLVEARIVHPAIPRCPLLVWTVSFPSSSPFKGKTFRVETKSQTTGTPTPIAAPVHHTGEIDPGTASQDGEHKYEVTIEARNPAGRLEVVSQDDPRLVVYR